MRAVSAQGNTVDSLRVAVLAALNIADELCTARQRLDSLAGNLQTSQHSTRSRATTLSTYSTKRSKTARSGKRPKGRLSARKVG